VANAISRDTGICKGIAVLFNNALDTDIFSKCIKLLKRFYAVICSLVSHVNCCHVVSLFVIFKVCLINKWTVYCNGVRWLPYHRHHSFGRLSLPPLMTYIKYILHQYNVVHTYHNI
jgi:hypothetical protein